MIEICLKGEPTQRHQCFPRQYPIDEPSIACGTGEQNVCPTECPKSPVCGRVKDAGPRVIALAIEPGPGQEGDGQVEC